MAEPVVRSPRAGRWLARILRTATIRRPGCTRPGPRTPRAFTTPADLRSTLERHVDFDRLNAAAIRLSVGAVNVRSGKFVYFDTQTHTIGPE